MKNASGSTVNESGEANGRNECDVHGLHRKPSSAIRSDCGKESELRDRATAVGGIHSYRIKLAGTR
jgi:hypothetical protein